MSHRDAFNENHIVCLQRARKNMFNFHLMPSKFACGEIIHITFEENFRPKGIRYKINSETICFSLRIFFESLHWSVYLGIIFYGLIRNSEEKMKL